jgi:Raf kinase inhibitor-like YbhB/YbcL family protein
MIKNKIIFIFFVFIILFVWFFRSDFLKKDNNPPSLRGATAGQRTIMQIKTSAFISGGSIPPAYTCNGQDIIPPLQFLNVPKEAKSLALIIDDPDAVLPGGWDHYVAWNISPDVKGVVEGILPAAVNGKNSWGELGYKGPCPPKEHQYYFKLFALDALLDLRIGGTKKDLMKAMKGHILGETEIFGKYKQ